MEQKTLRKWIRDFNHSELRRRLIPAELASGWPSICMIDGKLCVVIPYFNRRPAENGYLLYPIYCSVTVMYKNMERLLDFTIYPAQPGWSDVDYSRPAGRFKHAALADVNTRGEYEALCSRLYDYYDEMIGAVLGKRVFAQEEEMTVLFTKLMEPSLYPYYERINKKFYSNFYRA